MIQPMHWLGHGAVLEDRVLFDSNSDVAVWRERVGGIGLTVRHIQRRDTAPNRAPDCRVSERIVLETRRGPLVIVYEFRTFWPIRALLEIRLGVLS